jgi:uncharacterized protein involved in exopolysaccharide biosynthesis
MAANQPKDILSRVADLGEEALHKLPSFPGADRLTEVVNQSRTRLDDVQKKLRGLDVLERRVDELEKRLAKLEKPAPAKKPTAPRSSTKKPTTPKKPPA